jgi:hypothetical protein
MLKLEKFNEFDSDETGHHPLRIASSVRTVDECCPLQE